METPTAAQRILCCWFSGACEKMGQVPQRTGRVYGKIKVFFQIISLVCLSSIYNCNIDLPT
jgi:hypothetical protein